MGRIKNWIKGTGAGKISELTTFVNKDLDVGTRYFQFTTAGTIKYPVNLSSYVNNGYISYYYYNGTTWALRSGLINAPVTGVAYANGILTFTGANINDRIANVDVLSGVKV